MGEVVSLSECEGCGTRQGVKMLLIGGLSNITGKAHPICRECAGDIGGVTDEEWSRLQSVKANGHG